MIKVLQVGFTPNYGGVESCIMNYYRSINKEEVQFGFLNIYKDDIAYQDEIIKLGGQVHKIKNWNRHPFKMKKELIDIINNNNYNIVHFNMNGIANFLQFYCAEKSNAKWIVHSHIAGSVEQKFKRVLEFFNRKYIKKHTKILLACSEKACEYLFHCNSKNSNAVIIRNAIDLSKFKYNEQIRNELRAKYGLEDDLVIGTVGRIEKVKNHLFLVDIFNELVKYNPKSKLVIVGEGSQRDLVEKKISEYNLEDKVLLLGSCRNVNELYQLMDIFVMPSLFEGLPVVGIEAQAEGLPAIFSENITKELSITTNNKFLSLNLSPKDWAEECLKSSKIKRDKDISSELYESGFDISNEANKLLNIYKELL